MTATNQEVVERFKTLHEYDLKILRLDQELRRGPAALKEHHAAVKQVEKTIQKIRDQMRLVRGKRRIIENELLTKEEKVNKLQDQAGEVRTNKDFMAFRSEIANSQDEAGRLQNEILKYLDIDEKAEARITQLDGERESKAQAAEAAQAQIDERLSDVKQARDDLVSARCEYTDGLPEESLSDYERTRRKLGRGAAVMEGAYCGACGDMMTKNEVYCVQNRTRLVFCRSCNTMLYLA